jgi:diguanylate cyclase (GGDEF)-like protein
MEMTENEKVIRKLYQITSNHENGFADQIRDLLIMGCERFGVEIGILSHIVDNTYRVVYQVSPDSVPLTDDAQFDLPETYCAVTMAANEPVGFEHVAESEINTHPAYKAFALEAYIGIPIIVEGVPYGTLNFSSPYPRERKFSSIDIDALKLMGIWVESELSRIKFQEKIVQQADELAERNKQLIKMTRTDSLTQVGNRHSFYEELSKYIKFSHRLQFPVSIVMVDLDQFKKYNDTFGHLAGDEALKTFASTIASKVRSTDYVARYGGEEFIILLPDTSQDNALHAAERYRAAVNSIETLECPVSASFGVTTYFPYQERKVDYDAISEKLTDEADQALYYSKHNGKNCVTHFNNLENLETKASASS